MNAIWQSDRETAIDPEAHEARLRAFAERARVEGSQAWLGLLSDRQAWKAMPGWAQDLAIEAAAARLQPDYEWLGTETFTGGGQSHRIATFRLLGPDPKQPYPQSGLFDWHFRLLPGGAFLMGSPETEPGHRASEGPLTAVTVPAMLMGVTPVSRGMWRFTPPDARPDDFEGWPADLISWSDASRWVQSLADPQLGLPSESCWEFACRAGTEGPFSFYEQAPLSFFGVYALIGSQTRISEPCRRRNAFGLYDMHGTPREWCADDWSKTLAGTPRDGSARRVEKTRQKVVRGGPWELIGDLCRSACRLPFSPAKTRSKLGFRLCRPIRP